MFALVDSLILFVVACQPTARPLFSLPMGTAVLTYIKSTWPADNQSWQWEATLREQEQAE